MLLYLYGNIQRRATHTPPVAPAVVLNEVSDSSSNNTLTPKVYSYPVATFVSNFVRTQVNELRDHLGSHIYAVGVPEGENSSQLLHTRSESHLIPASSEAAAAAAAAIPHREYSTMRNLNFLNNNYDNDDDNENNEDASTEFVLVDGDLVEIPSPPPNTLEQEEMEFMRQESRASCRSSRKMGKGMRGLKKWMKRKKLLPKKENQQHH
jgi:hypothetical protein